MAGTVCLLISSSHYIVILSVRHMMCLAVKDIQAAYVIKSSDFRVKDKLVGAISNQKLIF